MNKHFFMRGSLKQAELAEKVSRWKGQLGPGKQTLGLENSYVDIWFPFG